MPELPEVETIRRGLAPYMEGQKIASVEVSRRDLRMPLPSKEGFEAKLVGRRIQSVGRRAKYLCFLLEEGGVWVSHLGMSGKWLYYPDVNAIQPQTHDHVTVLLESGAAFVYHDPRRFGYMGVIEETRDAHPWFAHLGVEPLGNHFSAAYLCEQCYGRRQPIKVRLMDQRMVVGVGNIYASESLHRAGIAPQRPAASLGEEDTARLVQAVREVLQSAIDSGGSTLRDYVRSSGDVGYFQHQFRVYGRAGELCRCGGVIRRMVQTGRASFYCDRCQA